MKKNNDTNRKFFQNTKQEFCIMIEYKEISWTGLLNGMIDSERLDCISIRGSLAELLNDGDKNLGSFSIRPLDGELPHNRDSRIIVRIKDAYPCNADDYFIGRKLKVSGGFYYCRQKDSKVIGMINADKIKFIKR